ncbi:unnamed protein product [Aphanomyces euteiches]
MSGDVDTISSIEIDGCREIQLLPATGKVGGKIGAKCGRALECEYDSSQARNGKFARCFDHTRNIKNGVVNAFKGSKNKGANASVARKRAVSAIRGAWKAHQQQNKAATTIQRARKSTILKFVSQS